MLKYISSTYDYRDHLKLEKFDLSVNDRKRLGSPKFRSAIHKLWKLDIDLIHDLLIPLYSPIGRPAIDPAVLIRSFLLMQHFGILNIHDWVEKIRSDALLQYLLWSDSPPSVSSHYDFISRLTGIHSHLSELYPKGRYSHESKKKPKKGEKLINYSHTDTYYLADKYKNGAACDSDRTMFTLQAIFNALVVIPSVDLGFIDSKDLVLSGDGSALHIHSSPYGHKAKDGDDTDNTYRYSAPDADIGWDSDLGVFYFGYTFYSIAYHNPKRNIDLPVFITLEKASRHDALTTISATAQYLDEESAPHPKYMCFDSASDSLPIYGYLRHSNTIPIIDQNQRTNPEKRTSQLKEKYHLNDQMAPVCQAGVPMYHDGYDVQRCRTKFRCPMVMGRIDHCPFIDECSTSSYGRTVYINDNDDIRMFGPVPYRSEKWKEIYKNRTSTERINNRVLNAYHLHQMRIRGYAKFAFFAIFAGINIHLDAWVNNN